MGEHTRDQQALPAQFTTLPWGSSQVDGSHPGAGGLEVHYQAIEFRQIQKDGGITNGFALFWLSDLIIKQVSVGFCCFALHSEGLGRGC